VRRFNRCASVCPSALLWRFFKLILPDNATLAYFVHYADLPTAINVGKLVPLTLVPTTSMQITLV
jgi:hypothetical protein